MCHICHQNYCKLNHIQQETGDYRGTIIFEIDIMKNSSPLNLKFTFLATVKTKITLLYCWTHSTPSSVNQNKINNQTTSENPPVSLHSIFELSIWAIISNSDINRVQNELYFLASSKLIFNFKFQGQGMTFHCQQECWYGIPSHNG